MQHVRRAAEQVGGDLRRVYRQLGKLLQRHPAVFQVEAFAACLVVAVEGISGRELRDINVCEEIQADLMTVPGRAVREASPVDEHLPWLRQRLS